MNEYAKKMIQKDPMMYVNANGDRPLPQRLMRHEFTERGRHGRVMTRMPATGFDAGMPGQEANMPAEVRSVYDSFMRKNVLAHAGGGLAAEQSPDALAIRTGLAEQEGNTSEMDAEAKAQRENKQFEQARQEGEDIRKGLEGFGEGLEGLSRGITAARGEQPAPEARPGMKMPNMEMSGDEASKRASKFKEAYLAMLLGR